MLHPSKFSLCFASLGLLLFVTACGGDDDNSSGSNGTQTNSTNTTTNSTSGTNTSVATSTGTSIDTSMMTNTSVVNGCSINQRVQAMQCVPCPAGLTNAPGDDPAGADTTCDPPAGVCGANTYVSNNQCVVCPAGTTNAAGDNPSGQDTTCDPVLCQANQRVSNNSCIPCPAGEVSAAGADASGPDTMCGATVTCQANQLVQAMQCVLCPAGTANEAGDDPAGGDTTCDPVRCQANQRVQANKCVACTGGATNAAGDDASGADTMCDASTCAANLYVKANQCVVCPPGSTNAAGDNPAGADTMCDPVLCQANQRVSNHSCVPCPANTINPAGDDASGADTMCESSLCGENQKVVSGMCVTCEPGSVNTAGDDRTAGDTVCDAVLCQANQRVSNNSCVACPAGETNLAGDVATGGDTTCDKPLMFGAPRMSTGGYQTCAITSIGGLKCWGGNNEGQLGNNTRISYNTPVDVFGLTTGVAGVSTGRFHSCALMTTGGVKCWGDNQQGQLGRIMMLSSDVPVDVPGLTTGVKDLSLGANFGCVVTTTGGVRCWGENMDGQLGNGSSINSSSPVDVTGLTSGVATVQTGTSHACVLTTTGGVRCWGENQYGQLGNGTTLDSRAPVTPTGMSSGVIALGVGDYHVCAIKTGGALSCWGRNDEGQLASGDFLDKLSPVAILSLSSGVKSFSGGRRHSCALLNTGAVRCWGSNDQGQLGDGTGIDRSRPVSVLGLPASVDSLDSGFAQSCVRTTSGGVSCWGENVDGRLGNGTNVDSLSAVSVTGIP